jgi:predicted NBD/HSP70 family sugar kinase
MFKKPGGEVEASSGNASDGKGVTGARANDGAVGHALVGGGERCATCYLK